eukprot:3111760-Amphidinium_carterae.3
MVEVDSVNANLVLEVLMEVSVEDDEVRVSTVDEVESLMLGTVLTEHLMLPLLADVLDDVDDVFATRVVDVELGVDVELLGVANDRLVLDVLDVDDVEIDVVHVGAADEVELLVLDTVLTGHLMFLLLVN